MPGPVVSSFPPGIAGAGSLGYRLGMKSNAPPAPGNDPVYVPPGGPPQGVAPSPFIYARMGEEAVFRMCRDFYRVLEDSEIRPMFPEDMPAASERLACFLVGLFGGPPLYLERYGSPQMRRRHLAFAIDERARRVWLDSFRQILGKAELTYGFPVEYVPGFLAFLEAFSAWMVNRAPREESG